MQTTFASPSSSSLSSSSSTSIPDFSTSKYAALDTSIKNPIFAKPQALSFTNPRRTPPPQTMSNSPAAPVTATTADGSLKKEVKLWGGRFEESVTDVVEKFTESISFDKALYKHDIMGSRAHASMLAHQGLISESDRDIILQGLDEIERQIQMGEFIWRTDREDVHMNIEATLTDLVGEPAKKLHTARSRNDQVSTDFRLWCRDSMDIIVAFIKRLQVVLILGLAMIIRRLAQFIICN